MHYQTKDVVFVVVAKVRRLVLRRAWERACGTFAATVPRRSVGAIRADYIAEGNQRMKGKLQLHRARCYPIRFWVISAVVSPYVRKSLTVIVWNRKFFSSY